MFEWMLYIVIGLIGAAIIFKFFVLPTKQYKRHDAAQDWGSSPKHGVELGTEATDMKIVNKAEKENRRIAEKHKRDRKIPF